MKLAVIVCLAFYAVPAFGETGKIRRHKRPVPDSYIVVLKPTLPAHVKTVARDVARLYDVELTRKPTDQTDSIFEHAFQGFSGRMTEDNALALARDPRVLIVEENAYLELSPTQTFTEQDPHFNLDRVDQTGAVTAGNRSYTYQTTGSGVYIYVIDTGVQRNHIEFDNDNDPNTPQTNPRVLDGIVSTT